MKIQLHVGTKADLTFNLRHFWPMKSFRRPRLKRKTDCHFKISGTVPALKTTKYSHLWNLCFIVQYILHNFYVIAECVDMRVM